MNERAFTLLYAIGEADGDLVADAKKKPRGAASAVRIAACAAIALIPILLWAKLVFTGASSGDPSIKDDTVCVYYIGEDGEIKSAVADGRRDDIGEVFALWCGANGIEGVEFYGFHVSETDAGRAAIFDVSPEIEPYLNGSDADSLGETLLLTMSSNNNFAIDYDVDEVRFEIMTDGGGAVSGGDA